MLPNPPLVSVWRLKAPVMKAIRFSDVLPFERLPAEPVELVEEDLGDLGRGLVLGLAARGEQAGIEPRGHPAIGAVGQGALRPHFLEQPAARSAAEHGIGRVRPGNKGDRSG